MRSPASGVRWHRSATRCQRSVLRRALRARRVARRSRPSPTAAPRSRPPSAPAPAWSRPERGKAIIRSARRRRRSAMPVTPQKLAGWRIEPPVSVPVAASASAAPRPRPPSRRRPPGTALTVSHGSPGQKAESRSTSPSRTRPVGLAEASPRRPWRGGRRRRVERAGGERGEHLRPGRRRQRSVTKMSLCAIGTPSSGRRFAARAVRGRPGPEGAESRG